MKYTDYIVPIGEDEQEYDEMFIGVIRRQPELVRCKDCKYFTSDSIYGGDHSRYRYCIFTMNNRIEENDYCSNAEREEE